MAKTKQDRKVRALTGLLKRIEQESDFRRLCHEAGQLAAKTNRTDIANTQQALVENGYSIQMARQLLTLFVFMGLYEQNGADRKGSLADNHILCRIAAEHNLFRCYAAELRDLTETVMQLEHISDVSAEYRTLVRTARYLNMLWEHMDREEDIIFPYLRIRGYVSLCTTAEKEHACLRESLDSLRGLIMSNTGISLDEFKTRLGTIVRSFHPLLLDHLAFEEGLIHPIALVVIDNPNIWESIKALSDQIGYCELPA